MPFFCKERCGGNLLERERGKRQGGVMPSCAFLLDFLEEKEDKRERQGVKRTGRQAMLYPFYCKER